MTNKVSIKFKSSHTRVRLVGASALGALALVGCRDVTPMDPTDPGRGPGQLVGNNDPITDGEFRGGADEMPAPNPDVTPPDGGQIHCDLNCRAYCDSLGLENPVNIGMCTSAWGAGMATAPVDRTEACRRLYVDFVGRYPSPAEVNDVCDQPTWGDTVSALLETDEFILVNQRRWADKLLYNNRLVSVERAFDMDDLVRKTYEGRVSWDGFAAVTSAHPILTRRLDTPSDRAESLFKLFLGRPPYEHERADMARLYNQWSNGYWDHPHLDVVPDAYIRFACNTENGEVDPETAGECTSILWGVNELIMTPDGRVEDEGEQEGMMWSGYLTANEWEQLQAPGRIISDEIAFWEYTVEEELERYLGHDLAIHVPEVRQELVKYMLDYQGDVRSLHFAIATSFAYLSSSTMETEWDYRWEFGPLKQIPAEPWIDSIERAAGVDIGACDHRLPFPNDYLDPEMELGGWAHALVENSRWTIDESGEEVENQYSNLARLLGGCPGNEVGGRFTTVSILNTAVQEAASAQICGLYGDGESAAMSELLPDGMDADASLDESTIRDIVRYQTRRYFGREATADELADAVDFGGACTPAPCSAGDFARPLCFSLLSGAEMLFY